MTPLSKVTVPRSQWLRGEGSTKSYLWDPDRGKGCCLGHALSQICGVPIFSLALDFSPAGVRHKLPTMPDTLAKMSAIGNYYNTALAGGLMELNDSLELSDADREAALIEGGKDVGIEFTFTD